MDVNHRQISLRRQCELLGLNRSSFYYETQDATVDDIDLLNEIREIWERRPFCGSRRITQELRGSGHVVNRKRVQRLMRWGGIQPLYPGPNTSRKNKLHAVHPYLLRDLAITHANQVWMVDITYLRMTGGFMYLIALIDVYSRYIVAWYLSNTLDAEFCLEALKLGLTRTIPKIINSDQGCQFTSNDWVDFLRNNKIRISMTGKGRCLDNIYIERFWRSFKREELYLNEYQRIKELKEVINSYMTFYNEERWHQSLDYKRPAEVYFGGV